MARSLHRLTQALHKLTHALHKLARAFHRMIPGHADASCAAAWTPAGPHTLSESDMAYGGRVRKTAWSECDSSVSSVTPKCRVIMRHRNSFSEQYASSAV
eukprot:3940393-Rhodomonas_salina.2